MVIRGAIADAQLAALRGEIESLVETLLPGADPWAAHGDRCPHRERRLMDRCLTYLPGLMQLASNPHVLDLVRSLGLEQPAIMQAHRINLECPDSKDTSPGWLQDFTYELGSPNAVSLWAPINRMQPGQPLLEVIPLSHRQGVLPVDPRTSRHIRSDTALSPRDLTLRATPAPEHAAFIEAEPGDLVVLSAFAVHRRAVNQSNQARWTARLGYSDLGSHGFKQAGYPFGDVTNIFHSGYQGAFYAPEE